MPFNLNVSIEGLWPTISIINTIPEDLASIRQRLKLAILDIAEAQIMAEKKALLLAGDEKAELLVRIAKLEAEIKGLQNIATKPAKKGRGRPKKASLTIDHADLDDEEIRAYMAGKGHLMADPRF
jgi:hypothetical protein